MDPSDASKITSMNISLPSTLREFVEERVSTGYGSASEYIRELLRDDQKRAAQAKLEELLLEGINSGTPEAWTDNDWAELRAHVRKTAAKNNGTD